MGIWKMFYYLMIKNKHGVLLCFKLFCVNNKRSIQWMDLMKGQKVSDRQISESRYSLNKKIDE